MVPVRRLPRFATALTILTVAALTLDSTAALANDPPTDAAPGTAARPAQDERLALRTERHHTVADESNASSTATTEEDSEAPRATTPPDELGDAEAPTLTEEEGAGQDRVSANVDAEGSGSGPTSKDIDSTPPASAATQVGSGAGTATADSGEATTTARAAYDRPITWTPKSGPPGTSVEFTCRVDDRLESISLKNPQGRFIPIIRVPRAGDKSRSSVVIPHGLAPGTYEFVLECFGRSLFRVEGQPLQYGIVTAWGPFEVTPYRYESYNWARLGRYRSALRALTLPLSDFQKEWQSPWHDIRLNWTTDLCSVPLDADQIWARVFRGACLRHDFGYRNFGKSMALRKTEAMRTFIDDRFLDDMNNLCSQVQWWRRGACQNAARAYYNSVHHTVWGRNAFFR